MSEAARILIAYDGSACSDAAVKDLRRAGLPANAEAVVLTVADVMVPPPADPCNPPAVSVPAVERHAREKAERAAAAARADARRAARLVKYLFPAWDVRDEVECDAPAWAVVRMADRLHSDLVVLGGHRHFVAGGRLILGSTSQRVLHECRCSVRVARGTDERREGPARVVVGFNGSHAEAAVNSVASREWPEGSEVRLIGAGGAVTPRVLTGAAARLRAAGLLVSEQIGDGNAADAFIRTADAWRADSIFVATRGRHGVQHLLHGSVAAAVVARAQCSVEVACAPQDGAVRKTPEDE